MPPSDALSDSQIAAENLADWRKLAQALHARFRTPDLVTGAHFVEALAQMSSGLSPDVRLTDSHVDVVLTTRVDGFWVTATDVEYARVISGLAADRGLAADPAAVTQVELGLDTADSGPLTPFWAALLTGDAANSVHGEVLDPSVDAPNVWFQGATPLDPGEAPPRQRWHLDVWVAPEAVDARIAAVVAAGGTVVHDAEAPTFTVVADADGNRACVCTTTGR